MHALKPMPVIALDGSSAIDRLVVGAACHGYSTASQFHWILCSASPFSRDGSRLAATSLNAVVIYDTDYG
uniref:Uncharacterized protein n=1 Tax=Physcomitrium patens TaxID=3218 RepID=A0A7I4DPE6_PHYPA